jgi:heme/copper-type cytochrome/quinol oxidase subunit 3
VGINGEFTRENCSIIYYLVIGINFLSAAAGLAMVFSFIFAGYQYITARDNPQFVQAAKNRILWTLIALATFLFMYAGLNWLVPGGVLP